MDKQKETKKKLLATHSILLKIRLAGIKQAQTTFANTLKTIMAELGIPETEILKWMLSPDGQYVISTEERKDD